MLVQPGSAMVEVHFKNDSDSLWVASFNTEETFKLMFDKIQDLIKGSKYHTIQIVHKEGIVEIKWIGNGRG